MMAQSRAESTRDTYNYGQYLNQFPPNTIKVIREFERIQKKICRHKMSIMFNEICIYIYIYIYIYIVTYNSAQAGCEARSIFNGNSVFFTPVGLGYRIYRLHLYRGVRPTPYECPRNDIKEYESMERFGECGVPLHCHCSLVDSDPESYVWVK